MPPKRKDRVGEFRTALEKNKKIILATQDICGICGLPVDKSVKYPDPMSPAVDHIIPIAKGGHPSELSNLQLTHRWCNRQKSDKLFTQGVKNTQGGKNIPGRINELQGTDSETAHQSSEQAGPGKARVNNDNLPQHADWSEYTW